MILSVRVSPKASPVRNTYLDYRKISYGASRNLVKKENDKLKVYLIRPAQDGLANNQLIDLLAEYLGIKKYRIKIIKGHKSRDKLVEVDES